MVAPVRSTAYGFALHQLMVCSLVLSVRSWRTFGLEARVAIWQLEDVVKSYLVDATVVPARAAVYGIAIHQLTLRSLGLSNRA